MLSLFGLNLLIFCFLAVGHSWGGWDEKLKLPSQKELSSNATPTPIPKKEEFIELEANLQAQQQKKFYQNKTFLTKKGKLFQKWLQDTNISTLIVFEKIEYREKFTVQEEKQPETDFPRIYTLYLKKGRFTKDTCALYTTIDETITIKKLFFKFAHLLSIPPELAKLTINNEFSLVANKNGDLFTFPSVTCSQREPLKFPSTVEEIAMVLPKPLPNRAIAGIITTEIVYNEKSVGKTSVPKKREFNNEKVVEKTESGTTRGGINKEDTIVGVQHNIIDNKNLQLLDTPEIITNFFEKYFSKRGGKIQITTATPRFINLNVKSLRNEVIQQSNYWESLQITLFIFYKDDGLVDIGCVFDGQYAGGLGKLPPAEESFSDMEPHYAKPLQAYLGELLVNLQKYLATGDF